MIELNFSDEDIRGFIEKEIPDSEKPDLLKLLSAEDSDETSLEAVCEKYLEAEFIQSGEMSILGIRGDDLKTTISKIDAKIRGYVCDDNNKEKFDNATDFIKTLVSIVTKGMGTHAQLVGAVVTAIVIIINKIGIPYYCKSGKCTLNGGQETQMV